jgi:hypothetical protein
VIQKYPPVLDSPGEKEIMGSDLFLTNILDLDLQLSGRNLQCSALPMSWNRGVG